MIAGVCVDAVENIIPSLVHHQNTDYSYARLLLEKETTNHTGETLFELLPLEKVEDPSNCGGGGTLFGNKRGQAELHLPLRLCDQLNTFKYVNFISTKKSHFIYLSSHSLCLFPPTAF